MDSESRAQPPFDAEHNRERVLERLRWLERFLDNAILVPGLRIRIGYDAIIGLVPIAGDIVTAIISFYIVYQSHKLGVRKRVLLHMLGNIVLDLLISEIPGLGDLGDFFFKSNTRNLALLGRELNIPELASVGTGHTRAAKSDPGATQADPFVHHDSPPQRKHVENLAG